MQTRPSSQSPPVARISHASPAPSVKPIFLPVVTDHQCAVARGTVPGNSPLRNWQQGSALGARILLAGSRQANYVSPASLSSLSLCPRSALFVAHHIAIAVAIARSLLTTTASAATSTIDPARALRALEGFLDREPVNTTLPYRLIAPKQTLVRLHAQR
jgi:hypothetical protein